MSNPYQQPGHYDGYSQNPYASGQPGYGYPQSQPQQGYGYPQQNGYPVHPYSPYGGYGGGPTGEQNNLATAAVIMGFVSIFGSITCYLGLIAPVGIGVGIAGLKKSQTTGTGRNAAIGGIALSVLGLLITAALVLALVIAAKKAP